MIDKQFLESAKYIRSEYLSLDSQLTKHQEDLRKLYDFLNSKSAEIKEYSENFVKKMKTNDDLNRVVSHILKEINNIEDEEKKINTRVEKINLKMDKLRESEKILMSSIRERHPELTVEEIRKEIHENI